MRIRLSPPFIRRNDRRNGRQRSIFGTFGTIFAVVLIGLRVGGMAERGRGRLGGVPAFFAWLAGKYPSILSDVDIAKGGVQEAWDRVDNLYLDMNGIIHPCCHPEGKEQPKSEDEMMKNLAKLIDDLVLMAQPRNILYLAIDGVAPRAKMNQQRSRRFRAARERTIKDKIIFKVQKEMASKGFRVPIPAPTWDHNVITPGTEFMTKVASFIREYVRQRQASSRPGSPWNGLKVLICDATVPGEGEHKIMELVRRQRNQENYDPNTRHVIVGEDADLIMLALATHEPHFSILRVKQQLHNQCPRCMRFGHRANTCDQPPKRGDEGRKYHLVSITRLRSFIHGEFLAAATNLQHQDPWPNPRESTRDPGKSVQNPGDSAPMDLDGSQQSQRVSGSVDLERVIDDFVFLCIFVGNDFLPHLPGLEIREGALDVLLREYKKVLPLEGYLTESGEVRDKPLAVLLQAIGRFEPKILMMREKSYEAKASKKKTPCPYFSPERPTNCRHGDRCRFQHQGYNPRGGQAIAKLKKMLSEIDQRNLRSSRRIHDQRMPKSGSDKHHIASLDYGATPQEEKEKIIKATFDDRVKFELELAKEKSIKLAYQRALKTPKNHQNPTKTSENAPDSPDKIQPASPEFDSRYYETKFGYIDERVKREICREYLSGMRWVLQYYFQRCASWDWFFPFYYAPLACDMHKEITEQIARDSQAINSDPNAKNSEASGGNVENIDGIQRSRFTPAWNSQGSPLKPVHQLMAVLPPDSKHCLPLGYRELMVNKSSTIIDFYPVDFQIDPDKHKPDWQWVCCLPFIDKDRLLSAVSEKDRYFTETETKRNIEGKCEVYLGPGNKELPLDPVTLSADGGLSGKVTPISRHHGFYEYPPFRKHQARLLPGIRIRDELLVPRKSRLRSGQASRLLDALGDTDDRKRDALDMAETEVHTVEYQAEKINDRTARFSKQFFGEAMDPRRPLFDRSAERELGISQSN
ncbi:hypothetical protein AAMO2058_001698500 [Amorphochlora amoebiformis]